MNAIVDVQGFKIGENKFILKEIAISCNNHIQVFLIKPPFPFYDLTKTERRQVAWIERNRKIYWSEGFINYSNYKSLIVEYLKDKCIFTKGVEKVLWIKEILKNHTVYNLEDNGCPSLLNLYEEYESENDVFSCMYHPAICALKNVICLKKWILCNKFL